MSIIRSTLIGAAAYYAIRRLATDVSMDDVERLVRTVSGLDADALRSAAWDRADGLLLRAGLRRADTIPSSVALVMGGIGAGLVIGAGVGFFLMSDAGKSMRGEASKSRRANESPQQAAGTA